MPHDWLRERADYYEEIKVDHKDDTLTALKKSLYDIVAANKAAKRAICCCHCLQQQKSRDGGHPPARQAGKGSERDNWSGGGF